MDDLISRKSLLNKINAYVVGSQDKEFICKLIEEMPPARQWIPWVEHDVRLKDHFYYLVTHVDYKTPMKAKYHDEDRFELFTVYPHQSVYVWDGKITAWMPLPELYKGEEDG